MCRYLSSSFSYSKRTTSVRGDFYETKATVHSHVSWQGWGGTGRGSKSF